MSDDPLKSSDGRERRVLTRTSVCEITAEGQAVALRIGRFTLDLTPQELAALSGSCRSATRKLFPRRGAAAAPWLRLVAADGVLLDDEPTT